MLKRAARTLLIALLPALVAGCASLSTPPRPDSPGGAPCIELFAKIDAQIDAAGVRDGGYARVDGYPYLRVDRFSASFAREIPDMDAFWEWVGYLRANEDEARDIELRNLNLSVQDRTSILLDLRGCGGWLRSWELDDAVYRQRLIDRIAPPDEYSGLARTLGLYPLAIPFLRSGVAGYQRDVLAEFARPLAQLEAPGPLVLWKVQGETDTPDQTIDLRTKPRDRLGRIGLLESEIAQLARRHAPAFWIETGGDYDRPGMPTLGPDGPGVDPSQPLVYYLPGYTRFGGHNLLQLNYFVWFSERPELGQNDGAAGALDGLIWRITLDQQGRALMHDTIHACGCYHYAFAAQPLQLRDQGGQDPILIPQQEVPADHIAVRLASGSHAVRRVVAQADAVSAEQRGYTLKAYEYLLTLPIGEDKTRSLFGPDGFVAGSERSERRWLWPSGVRNAGAMRQWGRHATAFIGKRHFDDPFLFEKVFVPPQAVPAEVPPAAAPVAAH